MKIVQRYVLREFLVPLFYCLTGFVSIYVLFELFGSMSRMMEADFPVKDALVYFGGYLAPYFHYLVPAALMLATLYTMWTMCRHSELVAMRASGISFLAIVHPLLRTAFCMALLVTFVNEWFVPRYAHWAAQLKASKFDREKLEENKNIVFRNSREFRTWNVSGLAKDDGSSLTGVRVALDRPDGTRYLTVTAERADYLDGEWWFRDYTVQHHAADGHEIESTTPQIDTLPMRVFDDFRERPSDFMMQNRPWKFNSTRERFRYLRTHPELTSERRNDLLYDIWAQIMAPLACLVITLFAIPAGIASGRQSVFKGIVGALGMFFGFYGLTIGCMVLAKNNWLPAIPAAVLPAALFFVLGVRSFIKQR